MSNYYEEVAEDLFGDLEKKKKKAGMPIEPGQLNLYNESPFMDSPPEDNLETKGYKLFQDVFPEQFPKTVDYLPPEELGDIISDVKKARRKRKNGRF